MDFLVTLTKMDEELKRLIDAPCDGVHFVSSTEGEKSCLALYSTKEIKMALRRIEESLENIASI